MLDGDSDHDTIRVRAVSGRVTIQEIEDVRDQALLSASHNEDEKRLHQAWYASNPRYGGPADA